MTDNTNFYSTNGISENFLPRIYRSNANKKFLQATIDQLIQPGSIQKINGFIGRQDSKATVANDVFIKAATPIRQHYQLEPSLVIKDNLDNVTFFKDYQDYINQLAILGGNVNNHARINEQEFYSWNPHICWDKFVNFQKYYWIPDGPKEITINHQPTVASSTYEIVLKLQNSEYAYIFSPKSYLGTYSNPTITLYRGQTYQFEISSTGNPFSIRTSINGPYYSNGLSTSVIENGTILFEIPNDAPDILYYQSDINPQLNGQFNIATINNSSIFNVETDLLGKKAYSLILENDFNLTISNGIKIKFGDTVTPLEYQNKTYYIEGVGDSIKLVDVEKLQMPNEDFIINESDVNSSNITYVVINRTNQTYNQWSRSNRWFHQDVLEISANYHNEILQLSQIARATRPIIEFNGELKLFNYGTEFVDDVDLYDDFTKNPLVINGTVGYYIDDYNIVDLITNDIREYIRILFKSDGKIYKAELDNQSKLVLTVVDQTDPKENQVVLVKTGTIYSDKVFWYTTNEFNQLAWKVAQHKIISSINQSNKNQAPLFDVFDDQQVSFGDASKYNGTTFNGTKLFSYKINENNVEDPVLKLRLFYKNIENSGDIVFNFDFDTDTFYYKDVVDIERNINSGFLQQTRVTGESILVNGWKTSIFKQIQPAIRIYKNFNLSVNDTDKQAKEYNSSTRYYPGDIVRGSDGNLYQVKIDGSVSDSGISGIDPLNETELSIISYTINSTGTVIGFVNDTSIISLGDTITISSASNNLINLNGTWTISAIIDSNEFVFEVNKPIEPGNYSVHLGTAILTSFIPVWDFYSKSTLKLNNFDIDIFDNKNYLDDLVVQVYVNSVRLPEYLWKIKDGLLYKQIELNNSIGYNDILTIRAFSKQPINSNGYYQIPINLQQNPLNQSIENFTFGEILDHVKSIIDNYSLDNLELSKSSNLYNNLRDLGEIAPYGTKFVQHSGPLSLSLYHITNETNNIIRAITQSSDDYNTFKRNFITTAEILGVDADIVTHCNLILQELNKNKSTTSPYYLSDMVPYGAYRKNDFSVIDYRIKEYPLTFDINLGLFNLTSLSSRAVYVYLNNQHLCYGKEYIFTDQGFVKIIVDIKNNDIVSIYEYDTTDGCFIPETPTKLGLWPKYEPKIYWDTTLVTPRMMIQGHDGSLTLAYGTYPNGIIENLDYRDALLLELEKRIYNNIKVTINSNIFDIRSIIPGFGKETQYSLDEFNSILASNFYRWVNLVGRDFTKQLSFDENNQFTFNYDGYTSFDGNAIPHYWRGIYQWFLGTDRPHICPWEMLGFSEEPAWWTNKYGPAPYTSNNILMWKDISLGIISEPNVPIRQEKQYIKSFLLDHLPVNQNGELIGPLDSGLVIGTAIFDNVKEFVFGDVSPVEAAWRRSSHYPFSVINTALLMFPAKLFGLLFDVSRIIRNVDDQIVYKDTNARLNPTNVVLPNIVPNPRIQTAGIINYLINYIISDKISLLDQYKFDLTGMKFLLSYKLGGFTSKEKFNLLLDSKSPVATGNVFVPKEDYDIFLNKSSPIKKIVYSGVIITKLSEGFEVKGYIKTQPYFKYYPWILSGQQVNVGGISESYLTWTPNQRYTIGKIVEYSNKFYRVKTEHVSSAVFETDYFQLLPSLPIIGGREAIFRREWDRTSPIVVPYGTIFTTIQDVVDFLLGYGEWLNDQGFIFDQFNNNIVDVLNWETSAKEFLFWTSQNWSTGQDKWEEWSADKKVTYGNIIKFNGDYYRAIRNVPSSIRPNETDQYNYVDIQYYERLDGLSTVGSSVISLSPAAFNIIFNSPLSVVDDIQNQFYEYEIFSVNGLPISPNTLNFYREGNVFGYSSKNNEGIYGATFYLVQKEQVVVINNNTIFNDLIYSPSTGYKQDRIKVAGYVSVDWNGGFNAPGFIFDQAKIQDWAAWTDYALGDMVKHKEFYYSAKSFIPGSLKFDTTQWLQLKDIPSSRLIPNWSYKAAQFTDFHNLDSDNFDFSQQRMAQHLIGYQKRQYLNNIIKDDVSEFKFYQGMIIEKGTQNVFNKLFDALTASDQEGMEFYEEWALRVGRYGATSSYETVEFILDEAKFKNNPQGFELTSSAKNNLTDFIIRQTPANVYLKPQGYLSAPFPLSSRYKSAFRSAGSINEDDVRFICKDLSELLNQDINRFIDGDYIWCTFVESDWNIYKFVINNHVSQIIQNESNNTWDVTVMFDINLAIGDYIGLIGLSAGNGFYQIINVINDKTFKISAPKTVHSIDNVNPNQVYLAELPKQRVDYFDLLAENHIAFDVFTKKLTRNDLLWVEGDLSTPWTTWIYDPVYKKNSIWNYFPNENLRYGKAIAVNLNGTICAVSSDNGKIFIFDRTNSTLQWNQRYQLTNENLIYQTQGPYVSNADYFEVLAVSKDGRWLAASTPSVKYVGIASNKGLYVTSANNKFDFKSQGVVSLYKRRAYTNHYELEFTFASPDCLNDSSYEEKFGSSLVFGDNVLFIGAVNNSVGKGKVYSLSLKENTWSYDHTFLSESNLYKFGHKLAVNFDNSILAISAKGNDNYNGAVNLYKITNSSKLLQIPHPDTTTLELFGHDVAFSLVNDYIAISSIFNSGTNKGQGIVYVYSIDLTNFTVTKQQQITRLTTPEIPGFGDKVAFINNKLEDSANENYDTYVATGYDIYAYDSIAYDLELSNIIDNPLSGNELSLENTVSINNKSNTDTLVIYDNYNLMGYDNPEYDATFYDKELYPYELNGFGLINIYDVYFNKWIRSEVVATVFDDAFNIDFGVGFATSMKSIIAGAPKATDNNRIQSGKVFEYSNKANKLSWTIRNSESFVVDVYKIKRAFLYNRKTNKLVTNLDVIDCFQGKISGIADQEIKFKTYYDPAIYSNLTDLDNGESFSVIKDNNTVNIDNGTAWTKSQIGTLWWDLKKAKFIDVYDRDVVYRNSFQNTLVVGGSIDIYEWVESKYKPSEWNELADTEEGYSLGISGTSLYDDTVYSVARKYDKISKSYKSLYYFWVKNKRTIPNILGRKLSSYSVANLISNARGEDYKYLAVTGTNSFSLINVEKLLISNDIVLSIEYWITNQTNQNIHSEWYLISNQISSQIPKRIEQKWFDSLVGKDLLGLSVPDLSLSKKIRYGVENRPRQSMFMNRFEALKELVDYANIVLKNYQIVEKRNISRLYEYDEYPSVYSAKYDIIIDSNIELSDINIQNIRTALLVPIIINGRITAVNIVDSGYGYGRLGVYSVDKWIGPDIIISGNGQDAVIKSIINDKGEIVEILISESGKGYDSSTRLFVRSYSVLVKEDTNTRNRWSIYSYDLANNNWNKVVSQSYAVTDYWEMIDWYAEGYNQFSVANYAVDTFVDLISINADIGELIKIREGGAGKWILLRKYSNVSSLNWNETYETVGSKDGTIQLNPSLYNLGTNRGYDGSFYDSELYDSIAIEEIRTILEILRDDIFIDDLKIEYLNLFFTCLRYALSEQNYIDWAFKTSFIKAKHNVGQLNQKITYKNDNLENFEDYIAEVKPYRTKIREYVSCYNQLDEYNISVTDFDLPPVVVDQKLSTISAFIIDEENPSRKVIVANSNAIQSYPWKHWYDNCKPAVIKINVISTGFTYTSSTTKIIVVGECEKPATAEAVINSQTGAIESIVVTDPGQGYYIRPAIEIIDEGPDPGYGAMAIAEIGSLVRSSLIKMKFDRIMPYNQFDEITETEEFKFNYTGDSNQLIFELKYTPSNKTREAVVYVNGVEIFEDSYSLSGTRVYSENYTIQGGKLNLTDNINNIVPLSTYNNSVKIRYYRDQTLLPATDRINYYYTPALGESGKNISQLMQGVDYGGVSISGLNFVVDNGWDSLPFYSNRWDSSDPLFTDVIFIATDTNKNVIKLPTIPENSSLFNVYYSKYYNQYLKIFNPQNNELIYSFDDTIKLSSVFTTHISQVNQDIGANQTTLFLSDTTNINIGDIITSVDKITGNVSSVDSQTNSLTLDNIDNLSLNELIMFSGELIGGLTSSTFYYIDTIDVETNQITLRTLKDVNSAKVIDLITETGAMTFTTAGYFVYNTTVTSKTDDAITISYPIIKMITPDVQLQFIHKLIESEDVRIYSNGTIILTNPIPYNHYLHLEGYYREIRIDDIKFNKVWTVTATTNQNTITLDTTNNPIVFNIGDLIKFTGNTFGNILSDITYFIHDILDENTITVSANKNDIVFDLTDAIGTMTMIPILDKSIIMPTWTGDGINDEIIIPDTLPIYTNDKIIIRSVISDGTVLPFDSDYDTNLDGGDIAYSSAKGILADDIIIDGDDFGNAFTQSSLEELLPGHVIDTLAIKVYDKVQSTTNVATNIVVDHYTADSINAEFNLSQIPNDPNAIFVKINDTVVTEYTFDIVKNIIIFNTAPKKDDQIHIFNIGLSETVLGIERWISDGNQTYQSKQSYSIVSYQTPVVYVDDIIVNDIQYIDYDGELFISFDLAPTAGALITVIFIDGTSNLFATLRTDVFSGNSTNEYNLPYDIIPANSYESNIIVQVNQEILYGPSTTSFVISTDPDSSEPILVYSLDPVEFPPSSISSFDKIVVTADNNLLEQDSDYFIVSDLETGIASIEINLNIFNLYQNKVLSIFVINDYNYTPKTETSPAKLTFSKNYTSNDIIKVIGLYDYTILGVQRDLIKTSISFDSITDPVVYRRYTSIASGLIKLDQPVINDKYVWVVKDRKLLTPIVDYKLNEDYQSIQLTNIVEVDATFDVITFNNNIEHQIAYMQFKDMLNRTHFIRLNQSKQTKLTKELKFNDLTIEVEDTRNFDIPNSYENKPGVIEINGERIEYFSISGNSLGKLRRGTLGTGVAKSYPIGSIVQDIGPSERIPYADSLLIDEIPYNNSTVLELSTINNVISNDMLYKGQLIGDDLDIKTTLAKDSIDIFVGGYITSQWGPKTQYLINNLVTVNGNTYRCIVNHISALEFKEDFDLDKWEFFVKNIRLIKNPYSMHNYRIAPISPNGDIEFDADYIADGLTNEIILNNRLLSLSLGTKIVVTKRIGLDWDSQMNIRNFEQDMSTDNKKKISEIAKFIKNAPGSKPNYF